MENAAFGLSKNREGNYEIQSNNKVIELKRASDGRFTLERRNQERFNKQGYDEDGDRLVGKQKVEDNILTFLQDKKNWPLVGIILGAFFVFGMIVALGPLALLIGFGALIIWANNKKKAN